MPFYYHLKHKISKRRPKERKRTVENLLALRRQLDRTVPPKDAEDNLLLATWNIRDFGKPTKLRRGWGPRLPETWFYIAEVISRFDIVAIQEVNEIDEWEEVMDILGYDWDYIATDETDRAIGGNGERMIFVYDTRKVSFENIAGEIVLPSSMLISKVELDTDSHGRVVAGKQFRRTPFMASFQSGWLKFDLCTVHLYYGDDSGAKLQERVEEIGAIAKYLSKRADRALGDDRAPLVLGDFNIVSPDHKTMKALTSNGFVVPKALQDKPTTGTAKHYDQIGFKTRPELLEYVETRSTDPMKANAGVVPLFGHVFATSQFPTYRSIVKKTKDGKKAGNDTEKLKKVYKAWRTYQFSDHYPMWVRLSTDSSQAYLERMLS